MRPLTSGEFFEILVTKLKHHVHVLKHSVATHLLDAGWGIEAVRDALGHKSVQCAVTLPIRRPLGNILLKNPILRSTIDEIMGRSYCSIGQLLAFG